MTHQHCLNCDSKLSGSFCSTCGQKADTHRITLRNLVMHDLMHGIFHLEKGILFTAREALTRPGEAAQDYIAGKRKRYYNVFYLILITFGTTLFFRHLYGTLAGDETVSPVTRHLNEASQRINQFFAEKSRLIVFLFVPLGALNSFVLFRKQKPNLSEHAIISGVTLLGILLISLFGNLAFYLDLLWPFSSSVANGISYAVIIVTLLYVGYAYYNAFNHYYTAFGTGMRMLLFYVLLAAEVMALLLLLIGYMTHWEFTEVTVNPFG